MKSFYPLVLAAVLGTPALAQSAKPAPPAHRLEFGLGRSLNGSGDYYCSKAHLGYTRALGRHFSIGPRLAYVSGKSRAEFGPGAAVPVSYRAVNAEAEAYYAPFGTDRRFVVALGAGAYAGYTRQYDFSWASYSRNPTTGEYTLDYQPRTTRGYHLGYLASLNADYAVDPAQRWLLGLKVTLQNDTYGNTLFGPQLRVARRL